MLARIIKDGAKEALLCKSGAGEGYIHVKKPTACTKIKARSVARFKKRLVKMTASTLSSLCVRTLCVRKREAQNLINFGRAQRHHTQPVKPQRHPRAIGKSVLQCS